MQSSLLRIDRNVWMFSCKVLKIKGVLQRIEVDLEVVTVRVAGVEVEKMKAVPLIHW